MKKSISIFLVFAILVISFWLTFDYISHDGEFIKISHTTAGIENFEDGTPLYLGYDFRWEGIGNPILEEIEFIKSDGTVVSKDDDEIHILPYIAMNEIIGGLDEETVISEKLNDDFVDVKGFQVDEDFKLVIRVEFSATNVNNDIGTLRIKYKKYGLSHFQNISFDNGVITDY